MKNLYHYYCIMLMPILLLACKQTTQTTDVETKAVAQKDVKLNPVIDTKLLYQSPAFLSDATGKTIRIVADDTSYDEKFGESYRVLKVYQEINGEEREVSSRLLPVNASPDYRYNFADVYAKDQKEWVIIQGFYFFFLYDVVNDRLSEKIYPPKPKDFEAADAQSGRIISLSLKDKQLEGVAQDIGTFSMSINKLRRKFPKK